MAQLCEITQWNEIVEKRNNTFLNILTLGLSSQEEIKKLNFKKDEKTCKKLMYHFQLIIERLLICWKEIQLMNDYSIYDLIDLNSNYLRNITQEEVTGNAKIIIQILEPLCYQFKSKIFEVFLIKWIQNNKILAPTNLYFSDILISNVKILDMVLLLNLSPQVFLGELKLTPSFQNIKILDRYVKFRNKKFYLLRR